MPTLWYIEFPSTGPFGAEAADAYADLAADISGEQGLIWKVWTEAPERELAGGIYLFTTREDAERFAAKHTQRLADAGTTDVTTSFWDVHEALSHAATPGGSSPLG